MSERGPYLTHSRAIDLERKIAELEGRWRERFERQDRELAELRRIQTDGLRAQIAALINVLRGEEPQLVAAPERKEHRR